MKQLLRLKKLQSHLESNQGLVLARPDDIKYYTGFNTITSTEREAYLVVTKKEIVLLYPSFSPVEKIAGIKFHSGHWPSDLSFTVTEQSKNLSAGVSEWFADLSSLFADEFQQLKKIPDLEWHQLDRALVWNQRMIKDAEELEFIQQAEEITQQAYSILRSKVQLGVSEKELANEFEYSAKKLGATSLAFPPVIAFGPHSALPHHQPTGTVLENNQAVLIDVGAKVDGYCADMTRTIWFGDQPDPLFSEIQEVVEQAYQLALEKVRPQALAKSADVAARDYIAQQGYGKQFIHSTGHGLGLEIHEPPSLHESSSIKLKKNMVVTVEPGIYLPGKFGYRYENTVIVK